MPSSIRMVGADLKVAKGAVERVLSSEDLRQKLLLDTVEVDDPDYVRRKRYAGYWLTDVLALAGLSCNEGNVLVFSALDGYQARITVVDVLASKARGFVAVRDLDAPERWEKLRQGKEWVSPAPYYLVWQKESSAAHEIKLPWPYQMVGIEIRRVDEEEQRLFPAADEAGEAVVRGFATFRQNCLACHSMNLEGGVLGPELNVPRNILEYREAGILKEFIGNPSSFRAKSKMPAFVGSLPSGAVDDVLAYFEWMGRHKVLVD